MSEAEHETTNPADPIPTDSTGPEFCWEEHLPSAIEAYGRNRVGEDEVMQGVCELLVKYLGYVDTEKGSMGELEALIHFTYLEVRPYFPSDLSGFEFGQRIWQHIEYHLRNSEFDRRIWERQNRHREALCFLHRGGGDEFLEAPEFYYPGLVDATPGDINLIYGPKSSGKTYVALDLALSMATMRPFLGVPYAGAGGAPPTVVYVEMEPSNIWNRAHAWCRAHGHKSIPKNFLAPAYRFGENDEGIAPLHFPGALDKIYPGVDARYYEDDLGGADPDKVIVFIDTYNRAIGDCDENATLTAQEFYRVAQEDWRLRSRSTQLWLVHHANAEGAPRGAKALADNATNVYIVSDGKFTPRNLKRAAPHKPIRFEIEAASFTTKARDGTEHSIAEGVAKLKVAKPHQRSEASLALVNADLAAEGV